MKKIIDEKIKRIEDALSDKVIIEVAPNINSDACVDFYNWKDITKLPKILHKPSIDKVHILHELIHLEMFFIDGYQIIAHYNNSNMDEINNIESTFKNIPEDYVANKIISDYGFNPIKETWFDKNNNINETAITDLEICAKMIKFSNYAEFVPKYKHLKEDMFNKIKLVKPELYLNANKVIAILENIDYLDKHSYNSCLNPIIKILSPSFC